MDIKSLNGPIDENTVDQNLAASDSDATPSDARQKFEQARITRRQALRKIGVTSGLALFSLLSIDDLARISASKLQEHKATAEIGNSLAKEFRTAGVAFATPIGPSSKSSPCKVRCFRVHEVCVKAANNQYQGFICGPGNVLCPSLNYKIGQCEVDAGACYTACRNAPPPDPNDPPPDTFDEIGCQNDVDQALLGELIGPLLSGDVPAMQEAYNEALVNCATDRGTDSFGECMRGELQGSLPTGDALRVKNYLECHYTACLAQLAVNDDLNPCEWGGGSGD